MWWERKGRECYITLEERPHYCDRGNWVAKVFAHGSLAMELDAADGWPRYYFDRDRAMLELDAWLKKRGQWVADSRWERHRLEVEHDHA